MPARIKSSRNWFTVRNQLTEPQAEILIYAVIGEDWYSEGNVEAEAFNEALKAIPMDREILVRINSRGGNVWDGMAIHSMLSGRKNKVTCKVDGVAASIASLIACSGKKLIMPANALFMTHPAQAPCGEDQSAAAHREIADKLDVHMRAIASVYAAKCGKSEDEMLAFMAKETWMTGNDAKEMGFCDEVTSEEVIQNVAKNFDFPQFRRGPGGLKDQPQNKVAALSGENSKGSKMDKKFILALLKEEGINLPDDAADEVVTNALKEWRTKKGAGSPAVIPQNVLELQNQVTAITNQLKAEKQTRITNAVNALVGEGRLTLDEAPKAIVRATADDTYIDELRARPANIPGNAPIDDGFRVINDDVKNVLKAMNQHIIPDGLGNGAKAFETSGVRNTAMGQIYRKERERIIPVMNAAVNTVDAALKRVVILNETVRAFAKRLIPLRLFATNFGAVPLQGTDEVVVRYYALQTAASSAFNVANGYSFDQATATSMKKMTANKRNYQPLDYSSQEFRRQPYLDVVRLGNINAEKLGLDTIMDVLSVITAAKFPGLGFSGAPEAMTSDDIITVQGVCNDANWPDDGRGLIVNSKVNTALQRDPAYKLALNIGGTEVLRDGKLPTQISGFEYAWMPNLPDNAEDLTGIATFMSAIGVVLAPVAPAPGVRAQLIAYESVTEPISGITMDYRHWGDPQKDRDFEIIETAYGYESIESAAIQRLTT